jgi:uncharacterized Zn-binding protein involved in type VI secretion
MTDRADDGPPSTDTLIEDVNGTPPPAGVDGGYVDVLVPGDLVDPHGSVSVDTSQDPGPVGGGWRSDITGQLLGAVGMGFEWAVGIEQRLSQEIFGKIAWGPHAAMRVGDWTVGIPHVHPPIAPWPPFGPLFRGIPVPVPGQVLDMGFLSGASTVTINGMAAARCGDMGVHLPFCLSFLPFFEIFFGSATVWIEGQRAARTLDPSMHCMLCDPPMIPPKLAPGVSVGPGSGDVFIGGVPLPSLVDFAVGKLFDFGVGGLTKGARRVGRRLRLQRLSRRFAALSRLGDELAAWRGRMQAARGRPSALAAGADEAAQAAARPGYRGPEGGFRNNMSHMPDFEAPSAANPRGSRAWTGHFRRGGEAVELPTSYTFDEFFDEGLYNVQTTLFASSVHPPNTRPFNYVIDADGNLWMGIGHKHSTLANGENVYGAGQMWIDGDGVIKQIDDGSGHYHPRDPEVAFGESFFGYLDAILQGKGVDTSQIQFRAH